MALRGLYVRERAPLIAETASALGRAVDPICPATQFVERAARLPDVAIVAVVAVVAKHEYLVVPDGHGGHFVFDGFVEIGFRNRLVVHEEVAVRDFDRVAAERHEPLHQVVAGVLRIFQHDDVTTFVMRRTNRDDAVAGLECGFHGSRGYFVKAHVADEVEVKKRDHDNEKRSRYGHAHVLKSELSAHTTCRCSGLFHDYRCGYFIRFWLELRGWDGHNWCLAQGKDDCCSPRFRQLPR